MVIQKFPLPNGHGSVRSIVFQPTNLQLELLRAAGIAG